MRIDNHVVIDLYEYNELFQKALVYDELIEGNKLEDLKVQNEKLTAENVALRQDLAKLSIAESRSKDETEGELNFRGDNDLNFKIGTREWNESRGLFFWSPSPFNLDIGLIDKDKFKELIAQMAEKEKCNEQAEGTN